MSHPTYSFLVTRPDESAARGIGSTHIPTFGHPASSLDAYRTVALHSIGDRPASSCLTDTDTEAALGRIVDGPIHSHADMERAESGLRALLLHDYVEILVPCAKGEQGNGFVHYIRLDGGERSEAAFEAFQAAPCRDLLFTTEYIRIVDGTVRKSTAHESKLVGQPQDHLRGLYRSIMARASEGIAALALEAGAATHFTAPELTGPISNGAAGFVDELYRRVYRPWMEVAQAGPPLNIDVKLPPLLAIVLSRASSRAKVPEVLRELRGEFAAIRADLSRMNALLDAQVKHSEVHAEVRKINESFDAIVPEALLTRAERRFRRVVSVFNILRPVVQLYSIAVNPILADPDKFQALVESAKAAVATDSRIVSRSVAATKLSELLQVDSLRRTVFRHFSDEERRLLTV